MIYIFITLVLVGILLSQANSWFAEHDAEEAICAARAARYDAMHKEHVLKKQKNPPITFRTLFKKDSDFDYSYLWRPPE